jgi:signal transduction histidine kinase
MMMCSQSDPFSPDLPPFIDIHPVLECLTALSYRSGNLSNYLTEIVQGVSRLIQSDWSIVTVCEGDTGQVVASSIDLEQNDAGFSVHGSLAGEVVQSGRSLIIEDSRREQRQIKPSQEYLCYLGIPLRTSTGEVIGTICSFLREPRSFTESKVKLVELFAERAATAIENYRLYQQQLQFNARLTQEVAACSIGLKQSQEKLIERERLAAIGEFTAMIVHEIRNPLTTISMGLRHAQKVLHSDADQQHLALSLSESLRLNHLLHDILTYAKPQVLQLSKLNINELLIDLLTQIQDLPEAADRRINYESELPEYEVIADSDKLKQVFINLFKNACEAIAPHETVSCRITDDIDGGRICISIHNGGTPIPPDILPQLATPFCSTKSSGTGLGLAISKRIITSHDGELAIASSSTGTTVSVYLPIVSSIA